MRGSFDVPGAPQVTAYLTFARGGTLTETNSNAAFEPQTLELHTDDEFTTGGTVQFFAGTSTTNPSPSGCARSSGVRLY